MWIESNTQPRLVYSESLYVVCEPGYCRPWPVHRVYRLVCASHSPGWVLTNCVYLIKCLRLSLFTCLRFSCIWSEVVITGYNHVQASCLWQERLTNKFPCPKFRERYSTWSRLGYSFLNPGFTCTLPSEHTIVSWPPSPIPDYPAMHLYCFCSSTLFQVLSYSRQPLSASPCMPPLAQILKSLPACSYCLSIQLLLGEEAASWAAMSSVRHLSCSTTDGLAPVSAELPFPEQLAFAIFLSPQPSNCSSALVTSLRHAALELKVLSVQCFVV